MENEVDYVSDLSKGIQLKEIEAILNPGLPGYWHSYQENSSKQLGLQTHK